MAYTYRRRRLLPAGMPQTRLPAPLQPRVALDHWTAGAPGEKGALSTIHDVLIAMASRNASYHEIGWWDAVRRIFEVIECVPADRAAHSVNPAQPPAGPWNPSPELRAALGDRWSDPNAHVFARSFAGMPADLAEARKDPDVVHALARWRRETNARFPSLPADANFTHGQGQPSNRYDWFPDLTTQVTRALTAPQEDDNMSYLDTAIPIVNRRLTIRATATARTSPGFDLAKPDANAITVHPSDITRTGIAYVTGTPLPNNPDATWVLTDRWQRPGGVFYHRQDVIGSAPIEVVGATEQEAAALEFAAADHVAKEARRVADAYRAPR